MRYLKPLGKVAFLVTLVAGPVAAYLASSSEKWPHREWLVLFFALFYLGCAVLMRSRAIAGAIIGTVAGVVVSLPVNPGVIGTREEEISAIFLLVVCVIVGALIGWAMETEPSNTNPDRRGGPDAPASG